MLAPSGQAEPGALRLLARRCAARCATRSLTDQAIAFGAGALEEAGVRQMLGARRPQPCGAPGGGARAARWRRADPVRRWPARAGPVGRRHAGGNGRAAAADGGAAGGAGRARCGRPRRRGGRAPRRRAGARRDAAALQHRAARPQRAGVGAGRIQRPGDGAAAHAGLPAGRQRQRRKPAPRPACAAPREASR